MGISYKDAGVDKHEGYREVQLIKEHIARTTRPEVIGELGGFSGMFRLANYKHPVLVSGTDGVGTKLKLAFLLDCHHTIGIDCVAMCVNDILCQGAEPLFFLDYIATGKMQAEKMAEIVRGVADGCVLAGASLIGGETAEMPGFYAEGEYDVAGFAVGAVEEEAIIHPGRIVEGDVLIGIPSSGLHSNGFSLVRKIVFDCKKADLKKVYPGLDRPLGEVLLTPTRIYKDAVWTAKAAGAIHGMSHITGGGFIENIPRMLPDGYRAVLDLSAVETPPVFGLLQTWGEIETREMYATFNMGIGLVMAVAQEDADAILEALQKSGEGAVRMGVVERAEGATGEDKCIL